jgi:ubiquinone biosynthesis protein UbiJ
MADAVLEILKVMQGDIAGLKTDVGAVKADLTAVKADLAGVKTEVRVHSRTLDKLLQEGRLLRAAVNDFAKENVTPGEVEAIHHDLNRLRHEVSELTVRVEMIEERGKPEH